MCGWESRDLRDVLETRWAQMSEDDYVREQAVLGDLSALDVSATSFGLDVPSGHSGTGVAELLGRVRTEDPDEP